MENINKLFENHPKAFTALQLAANFVAKFPDELKESIIKESKPFTEKGKKLISTIFPGDLLERYESKSAIWSTTIHLRLLPSNMVLFGVIYFTLRGSEDAPTEVKNFLISIAEIWLESVDDSEGKAEFEPCLDEWCTRWYDMKLGIPATPRLEPPKLKRSTGEDLPLTRTKRVRATETEGG